MSDKDNEYEKVCYLCRRTESTAGKMVSMPGGIDLCTDCMQKTFDTINKFEQDGNLPFGMFGGMPMFNNMNFGMNQGSNAGANSGDDAGSSNDKSLDNENDKSDDNIVDNSGDNSGDNSDDKTSDSDDKKNNKKQQGFPNISFINMPEFGMNFGQKQKIKKSKKDGKPLIDIKNIPAPHKIKEQLDEYIIGQEHAKKVVSVAVYNHYKRVAAGDKNLDVEIEKSNMLMIGPTGCGKTYLVKTLAKLLDVPLAIADATSLTEAGYIGDDIESVLSKLLAAADNDVDKAEIGIVFIDEIDKLAKKRNTHSRDVSGESVQQGLLKLLEGSEVEVPVGANSKNAMVPLATINTKNILFICGGAFPDLEDVIKERLNKQSSIGFYADLKDKYDRDNDLLGKVNIEDLKKFGMIPEFIGRLPVLFTLKGLDNEMIIKVLKEPKNAILKQYQKLLELDEVKLIFDEGAIEKIAELAVEKKIGARALRAIIEEFMLDIMYEIPKDDNIGTVTITKEYIEKTGGPIIEMRGIDA